MKRNMVQCETCKLRINRVITSKTVKKFTSTRKYGEHISIVNTQQLLPNAIFQQTTYQRDPAQASQRIDHGRILSAGMSICSHEGLIDKLLQTCPCTMKPEEQIHLFLEPYKTSLVHKNFLVAKHQRFCNSGTL